jgi:hypothetical protein
MLKIITFHEHTISAVSILVGDRRWGASYTVCDSGKLVQNSREVSFQRSPHDAEIAAIIRGIQYVQTRLGHFQSNPVGAH